MTDLCVSCEHRPAVAEVTFPTDGKTFPVCQDCRAAATNAALITVLEAERLDLTYRHTAPATASEDYASRREALRRASAPQRGGAPRVRSQVARTRTEDMNRPAPAPTGTGH